MPSLTFTLGTRH